MDMNPHSSARLFGRFLSFVILLACAFAAGGCDKLRARDFLNKGVQAYKAGQFDKAIEFFQQAKDLDPDLLNARLYLATAYASQYIPGAPSEENVRKGEQAVEEFNGVLQKDPENLSAIDGIGSILYQMAAVPFTAAKFERSKEYHLKHITLKPEDPEPYYWVGVIAWTIPFRANSDIRAEYNRANPRKQIKDEDPLPSKQRQEYSSKYRPMVDEGIRSLKRAIELRPDYEDAMAYLNLLDRRLADMVDSPRQREDLLREADRLVDQVKEIKQRKMTQPTPTS